MTNFSPDGLYVGTGHLLETLQSCAPEAADFCVYGSIWAFYVPEDLTELTEGHRIKCVGKFRRADISALRKSGFGNKLEDVIAVEVAADEDCARTPFNVEFAPDLYVISRGKGIVAFSDSYADSEERVWFYLEGSKGLGAQVASERK